MDVRRETRAHHAMAAVGGFFGVYALLTRGGTFGSSETSNLIYLVVSGLDGTWGPALVRLGGTACYIAGIIFAVLFRRAGKLTFYGGTLLCFHLGAAWGWWCVGRWGIPGVYGCLPLLIPPAVFQLPHKAYSYRNQDSLR